MPRLAHEAGDPVDPLVDNLHTRCKAQSNAGVHARRLTGNYRHVRFLEKAA